MARASTGDRGYGADWQRLRALHLKRHPWCAACGSEGPGLNVDHVKPHRGDEALRLDPKNLQTLCGSCHSRKTALTDGGFGR